MFVPLIDLWFINSEIISIEAPPFKAYVAKACLNVCEVKSIRSPFSSKKLCSFSHGRTKILFQLAWETSPTGRPVLFFILFKNKYGKLDSSLNGLEYSSSLVTAN